MEEFLLDQEVRGLVQSASDSSPVLRCITLLRYAIVDSDSS